MYGLGVWLRNLLYDEHVLYSSKPGLPTICVGNLAVGGTGKTPHVEYLAQLLHGNGFRVAVLSRGYKRSTVGFVLADSNMSADKIGDEPRQIKLKFPYLIVAVCEDRNRGIRRLQKQYPDLDVIILDDAFQHRQVRCGYNILLTPFDRLYTDDYLLPLGRLREPAHGALRADMVVVTKCPESMQPIQRRIISTTLNLAAFQELTFTGINYAAPRPIFAGEIDESVDVNKVFLLAGIGQPQYLRDYLGDRVVAEHIYSDHYRFEAQDIARILQEYESSGASCILTTEKDAVRLLDGDLIPEEKRRHFYYIPITILVDEDSELPKRVLRYVTENRVKRLKDK